ncbi:MAG: transcription termination factor Rho [Slackia sp.]|nr:transcription termination factor Rho [Slackia sp.]
MISDDLTSANAAEPAASSSEEAASAAAATPRKRPGRPRKKPVEDAAAADAQQDSASSSDASGEEKPAVRTRKRRSAQAASSSDAESGEAATPKRASSRRRVGKTEDAPAAPSEASEKTAASSDGESAAEKPAVRTRPGRSSALRAALEAPHDDGRISEAPSSSATDESDAAGEKPARRRPGRPRKVQEPCAEEPSEAPADERSDNDAGASANEEHAESNEASALDDGSAKRAKRGKQDRGDDKQRERRASSHERDARSERRQNKQGADRRGDRAMRNDRNDRSYDRDRNDHRRQRRGHGREPMVPKTSKEELAKLKVAELRAKAAELELDTTGLKKAELVEKVFEASVRAEGFIDVEGILDIMPDGYGFLRTKGYLPSENDIYVGLSTIRRNGLRKGDFVKGQTRPARENEKYAALQQVTHVNGDAIEGQAPRVKFGDLTPVFPDECLTMEHGKNTITARVIDLVSPIGKGQRGLIVSPPKAGKTTVLKDIAAAITANNPEVHLMCLLVDERPEEVTDMQRSIKGEVIASTFDMPTENHIAVSELVIERAKRLVERGEDVVILLDSLTRLARAYNLAQPASGRILSGGVDSTALYPPKRFLGAARNIEGGGSLTILASALIDTGSKMDEVIFEEFKGTGNMELKLDRALADRRVFPAIDPVASGTRREDLLLKPQEAPLIWAVRRILSNMSSTERAMDMLIKSLKQTDDNEEFLLRTAKKAQNNRDSDHMEL